MMQNARTTTSWNLRLDSARQARTWSEEIVTPPLFVLESLNQNDLALLQVESELHLLREEKVRPFYDVLEVGFALRADKRRHL